MPIPPCLPASLKGNDSSVSVRLGSILVRQLQKCAICRQRLGLVESASALAEAYDSYQAKASPVLGSGRVDSYLDYLPA